jgi:imidazolonepropionase-like amidohydrolase
MIKYLFTGLLIACTFTSIAQNTVTNIPDNGTFLLHKFAQNIGKETYKITKEGNNIKYDINFKFVDRGSPVPLKAELVITDQSEPVSLFIKGSTSRFSTINDTIRITNKQAFIRVNDSIYNGPVKPGSFPVGGYSPGTVQILLLQYWKKNKEPKSISLLPAGEVKIVREGNDTLSFNNQQLLLERFIISGLVWGNEIIWTDKTGNLVCLITNDAEGDKLEMMQEQYENLLPELLGKAANYSMQLFSTAMKINTSAKQTLAIVGGNIMDVERGASISNAVIIIENGIIKQTGEAGKVPIPANATIIHAEGKTILPGLWDMHSHFEQAEWGPAYLAAGVTTVRDCGNEFVYINAIKAAIDAHKGIGPNILKAGIIDGPGSRGLGIVRASTEEEAINAVQLYKKNGFAQIKIYSSVKPAIVKVICDEAHRQGLTVTGHIPNGMTIKSGVESGMDQVNHIQYVYSAMKRNKDRSVDLSDPANAEVLDFLKLHNTVIDPTIGVFEMSFRSVKDNITDMEPAFYSLPLPLQTLFKNTGMPEVQAKIYKPLYDAMKNMIKALHDKGVTIVAGTDMGFPGYSLARELELYVDAGLTPMQAIQTATIVPARVMNLDKQTGSITAGKQADLIIIDGDPLVQIRNIRKVWMVIKEGQQYDPATLHRMVGFKN